MGENYEHDQNASTDMLRRVVWPRLSRDFPGRLTVVEGDSTGPAVLLDREAGIDAYYTDRVGAVYSLASRVQPAERNWATFTVRNTRTSGANTELAKRWHAIQFGGVYPVWTLQAYVSDSQLLAAAIVKTEALIRFVIATDDLDIRANRKDGNTFVVVPWRRLSVYEWAGEREGANRTVAKLESAEPQKIQRTFF